MFIIGVSHSPMRLLGELIFGGRSARPGFLSAGLTVPKTSRAIATTAAARLSNRIRHGLTLTSKIVAARTD
jgi:hypothetical protein